jgi:hypothetical protein
MPRRLLAGVVTSLSLVLLSPLAALAGSTAPNARIVGHVHECNTPMTCVVQPFTVSATNTAGTVVAHTTTGGDNYFSLRVRAGKYGLTARSTGGLTCKGSATAVAHRTVSTTITCLVP